MRRCSLNHSERHSFLRVKQHLNEVILQADLGRYSTTEDLPDRMDKIIEASKTALSYIPKLDGGSYGQTETREEETKAAQGSRESTQR